ncbi:jg25264, partial [Pararge aegeria aegeria]
FLRIIAILMVAYYGLHKKNHSVGDGESNVGSIYVIKSGMSRSIEEPELPKKKWAGLRTWRTD